MVDQVFTFGPRQMVIVKLLGQHFAAGEIDPLRQSITVITDPGRPILATPKPPATMA
jgi:hypothetical protein